jgi:energy-converting hydrogenase Eha subunit G
MLLFRLLAAGVLLAMFGSGVVLGVLAGNVLGRLSGRSTGRTDFILSGMGSLIGLALVVFAARVSPDPVAMIRDTWIMCPLLATSLVLIQHVGARLIRR